MCVHGRISSATAVVYFTQAPQQQVQDWLRSRALRLLMPYQEPCFLCLGAGPGAGGLLRRLALYLFTPPVTSLLHSYGFGELPPQVSRNLLLSAPSDVLLAPDMSGCSVSQPPAWEGMHGVASGRCAYLNGYAAVASLFYMLP